MEERRRSKRTEMNSTLMVKRLDQGDMQEVSIDIVDVSPNGVGFLCKEVLSIGAVFIGMSESDAARIRVYQTINDDEKE